MVHTNSTSYGSSQHTITFNNFTYQEMHIVYDQQCHLILFILIHDKMRIGNNFTILRNQQSLF